MPVKARVAKDRRPSFSPDALALFAELEHTPARRRHTREFMDREHELARRLHLVDEWWGGNSVTDRSTEPCWPEWCVAHTDWHHCRAIREDLLQAIAG